MALKNNNKTRIVCRVTRRPILLEISLSRKKRPFSAIPFEQMIATRSPDLVSSLYISLTKNDFPPWHYFPLELYSAPGAGPQRVYQTSIGQGYKCKGNNNEGGFTKLKTSKRHKWILALTAAFVQQNLIQREVSRWFTYLTDRTFRCIEKKWACYGRINRYTCQSR